MNRAETISSRGENPANLSAKREKPRTASDGLKSFLTRRSEWTLHNPSDVSERSWTSMNWRVCERREIRRWSRAAECFLLSVSMDLFFTSLLSSFQPRNKWWEATPYCSSSLKVVFCLNKVILKQRRCQLYSTQLKWRHFKNLSQDSLNLKDVSSLSESLHLMWIHRCL